MQFSFIAQSTINKITSEVEKVTKGLENANRKGKKDKAGDEELDTKALTSLVHSSYKSIKRICGGAGLILQGN